MNTSKSQDSPSLATMIGRVVWFLVALLPVPLLALGWPAALCNASQLLQKMGSTIQPVYVGGDVGDLVIVTWNAWVGFFIGIQSSANLFRHLRGEKHRCNSWQFFLTLFSTFCFLSTLLFNFNFFIALSKDDLNHRIGDLIVAGIALSPVAVWFWINLTRLVKGGMPPFRKFYKTSERVER